jgi:Fe(3+) dicitrate transport protein
MSGGGAGTGDLFNAGSTVKGIELLATYDVIDNREKDSSYLLSYTFTDTKLKTTSIVRFGVQ